MITNPMILVGLGMLGGFAIGLLVARMIPQKLKIGVGVFPMGKPEDEDSDPSEAWKGQS